MKMPKILSTLIILVASYAHAATMEQAMYFYVNEEFDKAHQYFFELADLGSPAAIFNIGVMHARGEHVNVDMPRALAWVRVAMKHGHDGEKVEKVLLSKLSEKEKLVSRTIFSEVNAEYGPQAIQARFLPTVDKVSSERFQSSRARSRVAARYPKSAQRSGSSGYVDIEFSVAPDGTTRHHTILVASSKHFSAQAVKAMRASTYYPATLNGKPVFEFGRRMRTVFKIGSGEVEQNDLDKAMEEIKKKTSGGTGRDKYIYGYSLSLLRSFAGDLSNTLESPTKWFIKAAQDGNPFGKYELGKDMMYGNQCDVDDLKARIWLERAAADGVVNAQIILGSEYINGGRYVQDSDVGYSWLRKAAENGSSTAQIYLAWRLVTESDSSIRSPEQAKRYLGMLDDKKYLDRLSVYETKSAIYASLNDFKQAEKWHKRMIKEAKKLDLPTEIYKDRLIKISQKTSSLEL